MRKIKILPSLKKHYSSAHERNEAVNSAQVAEQLIENIATIKRALTNEPMNVVAFFKNSEFSISSELIALIDPQLGTREHPFSAHFELARNIDKDHFLAGTFIFDFNHRPSDAPYDLNGHTGLTEVEFFSTAKEILQSMTGGKIGNVLDMELKITNIRFSEEPTELMENWKTFHAVIEWKIVSKRVSKNTKRTISSINEISIERITSDNKKRGNIESLKVIPLSRSSLLVPDNYLELMTPILGRDFHEKYGNTSKEAICAMEAIIDSSISLFNVFALKRAELRNQVGRRGVFARTEYQREISNLSSLIVPSVKNVSKNSFSGTLLVRMDVLPFDGFISIDRKIGFECFDKYVSFVNEIAAELPGVILFEDSNLQISVQEFRSLGAGFPPFGVYVFRDVRSRYGHCIKVSLDWEASFKNDLIDH